MYNQAVQCCSLALFTSTGILTQYVHALKVHTHVYILSLVLSLTFSYKYPTYYKHLHWELGEHICYFIFSHYSRCTDHLREPFYKLHMKDRCIWFFEAYCWRLCFCTCTEDEDEVSVYESEHSTGQQSATASADVKGSRKFNAVS